MWGFPFHPVPRASINGVPTVLIDRAWRRAQAAQEARNAAAYASFFGGRDEGRLEDLSERKSGEVAETTTVTQTQRYEAANHFLEFMQATGGSGKSAEEVRAIADEMREGRRDGQVRQDVGIQKKKASQPAVQASSSQRLAMPTTPCQTAPWSGQQFHTPQPQQQQQASASKQESSEGSQSASQSYQRTEVVEETTTKRTFHAQQQQQMQGLQNAFGNMAIQSPPPQQQQTAQRPAPSQVGSPMPVYQQTPQMAQAPPPSQVGSPMPIYQRQPQFAQPPVQTPYQQQPYQQAQISYGRPAETIATFNQPQQAPTGFAYTPGMPANFSQQHQMQPAYAQQVGSPIPVPGQFVPQTPGYVKKGPPPGKPPGRR